MTTRVLDGVTVLELGQVYNGPYCCLLLAHLGAEVIKIEPPGGEPARHRAAKGEPYPFLLVNAGKQSLRLNLKAAAGRELFLRLAATADVVVENYRRGVLDKLGLGYEVLREVNPRLILARGRGFASAGPYRDLPAMDLTVQAMTGFMATTGFPDQAPVKGGGAVADFFGGVHLFAAVLAALLQRGQAGRGQVVEVAMQDALLPSLTSNIGGLLESAGTLPQRTGNRHGGLAICPYNVYRATDGWLAIFCATDRQWLALCGLMGRPDLAADSSLATNHGRTARMDEVDAIVEGWTSSRSRASGVQTLTAAGIPAAPVNDLAEVVSDPQIEAAGMLPRAAHPTMGSAPSFGNPLRLTDSPPRDLPAAPLLGADSRTVLQQRLGLSHAELDRLAADGVI
jgi:crotonobetainyl-CoA:carnitine CoA-transferase CaiB-like acyl-CoA transferase